jgi:flagellar hook-associated protein 1 FlgK
MTISSILSMAGSALNTNQAALRTTAQNVSNVNNAAYVRRQVLQESVSVGGDDGGVRVAEIRRIAAEFLTREILNSRSASGVFGAMNDVHARLQGLFGRPDLDSSLPSLVNKALASPSELTLDPISAPRRIGYLQDLNAALGAISDLSSQILGVRAETDSTIAAKVTKANSLIEQIFDLNGSIRKSQATSDGDSTLIDQRADTIRQLSDLMSISTYVQSDGSIHVVTDDGFALVTEGRTQLTYTAAATTSAAVVYSPIQAVRINPNTGQPSGTVSDFDHHIAQGELRGLLTMRDTDLPGLLQQLGELGASFSDQINAVHAESVAVPPVNALTGRDTGLMASDSLNFTGTTTLAVVNSAGALVRRVDLDFGAGTIAVNGAAPAALSGATIGAVISDINAALGATGTAAFTNGMLTISAANASDGVGFVQPATGGSDRGGRSFAHFFGLNNLVTGFRPSFFATGLGASDVHGFAGGETVDFVFRGPTGDIAKTFTYTMTAGQTIGDVVAALNDVPTGLGTYMNFTLDAAGRMTVAPTAAYPGYNLDINGDTTDRGGTGVSFTALFGIGRAYQIEQARGLGVDATILQAPSRLALAKLDIDATTLVGDIVATKGDGRGADALADLASRVVGFSSAGDLSAMANTIGDYASLVLANNSSKAASVEHLTNAAAAITTEVESRRSSIEGVNLDEELSNMVVYQQAYNAAARLVTVAKELYDALLEMSR